MNIKIRMIYLDNNATTQMSPEIIKEMVKWTNCGNPSASYATAKSARKLMNEFKKYIGNICGFSACCTEARDGEEPPGDYVIIFTSGASESNATAVHMIVESQQSPHIIVSAVEHKSVLAHLVDLRDRGKCELSIVGCRISGHVSVESIAAAIRPNTAGIFVMSANNETGACNQVPLIGQLASARGIAFHCDAVQSFGKHGAAPALHGITSFSVSFHKFGGPPGVGILCMRRDFIIGKPSLIYGSQNGGYRGGTENMPGIAAAFLASKINFTDRNTKNKKLSVLRQQLIDEIRRTGIPVISYEEYLRPNRQKSIFEIVLLSGETGAYLCNTLLISLVLYQGAVICNSKTKEALEANGIIVSVGSACNTASPYASHVLDAIHADKLIKKGTLRISLGDSNTSADVKRFAEVLVSLIAPLLQDNRKKHVPTVK